MIFLNGDLLAADKVRIDPTDRGLLLGDGLFETLRTYSGRIFRLDAHLARLQSGANALGIPLPLPLTALHAAVHRTLEANGLSEADGALRVTLTRGPGPRGLLPVTETRPTLLITAQALPPMPKHAATVHVASVRRNEYSPLSNLKSLNYLDNIVALQEAAAQGADEALLLNTVGNVAEASSANIFIVLNGVLKTPPLIDGVLPGITRAVILELALRLSIPVKESSLTLADMARAREAFLTNSLIEIRPVMKVGEYVIGDREVGPITQQLANAYRALVESM